MKTGHASQFAALVFLLALVAGSGWLPAHAQSQENGATSPKSLTVATRVVPPLVVREGEQLSGFSIDLWEEIAKRLGLTYSYIESPDVQSLLRSVENGDADLAVSAISITAKRALVYDFSMPILDAGLQVMVRSDGSIGTSNPLEGLTTLIVSPALLVWLGVAALLVIVPAHVFWLVERRHSHGLIRSRSYFPGIFQAMWWTAGALLAQADEMPRHWLARLMAFVWMFVGVVFVAYYTAQLTADLTVQEFKGAISGPDDIPGKKVATTRGSTAAAYVRKLNGRVTEVEDISDAYDALLKGEVDAVVFDAPVLLSYAAGEGKGRVRAVGQIFRKEDYGIAFKPLNPLRRKVDATLLAIREDGTFDTIYDKWFSSD